MDVFDFEHFVRQSFNQTALSTRILLDCHEKSKLAIPIRLSVLV